MAEDELAARRAASEGLEQLLEAAKADPLHVPTINEPGVYPDVTHAEYVADPVVGGSLSRTGAVTLMEQAGPAKFHYRRSHPNEEHGDHLDLGGAAHQLVLGDPNNRIEIVHADNWRRPADQDLRKAARAAGRIALLPKQLETVKAMAEAIANHKDAAMLLDPRSGLPEQTLVWRDSLSGVMCRARVDWLRHRVPGQQLLVPDYKSCDDASDDAVARSAINYGYHQQDDWYRAGVRVLGLDSDPAFLLIAQETKPPFLVNVVELNDVARTIGRNLNRGAINRYAEGMRTGRWPGYRGVHSIALPAWYTRQLDEDDNEYPSTGT